MFLINPTMDDDSGSWHRPSGGKDDILPTKASVASRPSAIVGLMRNSLSEATSGRALQPLWG